MSEDITATVIIITRNAPEMTVETVEGVLGQTIADRLAVVVLDNGSDDDTADALEKHFGDRITLTRSPENLGFAGGNNLAFQHATGKYLLLLNNDALAEPDWAEELIDAAEADPEAGMCTSKILTYHDRGLIDCAGHNMFADGISKSRGNWRRDEGQYDAVEETLLASGCAALYRRDAVMDWGGFDEDFFAYLDDVDLGLKLRLSGYKCVYAPSAVVYHHGSASETQSPFSKVFLIERNRIWVLLKYFPWTWVLLSPWYTLGRLYLNWRAGRRGVGRAGEIAGRHSTWRLGWTIVSAWMAALWRAPRMLRKRRAVLARRKVPMARFYSDLKRFRAPLRDMAYD